MKLSVDNDKEKIKALEKKLDELKEHNHPEIIGKKRIYNLDFINEETNEVLREFFSLTDSLASFFASKYETEIALTIRTHRKRIKEKLDSKTEKKEDYFDKQIRLGNIPIYKKDSMDEKETFIPEREDLSRFKDSGGEKELPKRENGLNHSHGINSETSDSDSKLPESICPKCKKRNETIPINHSCGIGYDIKENFYCSYCGYHYNKPKEIYQTVHEAFKYLEKDFGNNNSSDQLHSKKDLGSEKSDEDIPVLDSSDSNIKTDLSASKLPEYNRKLMKWFNKKIEDGSFLKSEPKTEPDKDYTFICKGCGKKIIISGMNKLKGSYYCSECNPEKDEFKNIESIQAIINHEHLLIKQNKEEIQKLIEGFINKLKRLKRLEIDINEEWVVRDSSIKELIKEYKAMLD